jgi:hypothetical protein
VYVGIGREQGWLIDALEYRAVAGSESRQRIAQERVLPVANGSDAVDEDEASNRRLIALGRQHRETTAPRVPEHVPSREPDRFADRGEVASVVLDARGARGRRSLRCAAPALIVQDQLASLGQWRERWPEEIVIEQQSAVDADERSRAAYLRREIDGELETACAN